jgi:hypothetical protein
VIPTAPLPKQISSFFHRKLWEFCEIMLFCSANSSNFLYWLQLQSKNTTAVFNLLRFLVISTFQEVAREEAIGIYLQKD